MDQEPDNLNESPEAEAVAETPPEAPNEALDDAAVDRVLDEYEKFDSAKPDESAPSAPETVAPDGWERAAYDIERLDRLETWAYLQEVEQLQAQENAEFDGVVSSAEQELGDLLDKIQPGSRLHYVRRFFINERDLNPTLRDAWHNVFSPDANPTKADAQFLFEQIGAAKRRLKKELSEIPDADATADRALITAAIMNRARREPPAAEEKSLAEIGAMSPGEKERYYREVAKRFAGERNN